MYRSESEISIIEQVDGNVSISSNVTLASDVGQQVQSHKVIPPKPSVKKKNDKISTASNLPIVASYNFESQNHLFFSIVGKGFDPKIIKMSQEAKEWITPYASTF